MSIQSIINRIKNLKDDELALDIVKAANQDSFFQQNTKIEDSTREKRLREHIELHQKYDLKAPERNSLHANPEKVYPKQDSLSTRYAPDMPGVQAMRVEDGVFQNPYTGKVYNYNEGFEVDGMPFNGGSPSLQSQVMTANLEEIFALSSEFKDKGLVKEARLLKIFAEDYSKK